MARERKARERGRKTLANFKSLRGFRRDDADFNEYHGRRAADIDSLGKRKGVSYGGAKDGVQSQTHVNFNPLRGSERIVNSYHEGRDAGKNGAGRRNDADYGGANETAQKVNAFGKRNRAEYRPTQKPGGANETLQNTNAFPERQHQNVLNSDSQEHELNTEGWITVENRRSKNRDHLKYKRFETRPSSGLRDGNRGVARHPWWRGPREPTHSGRGVVSLFVDGIPSTVKLHELRELFSKVGSIADIYISGKRRRYTKEDFGFVRFYNIKEAEKAIAELNGFLIHGQRIQVSKAKF